MASADGASSYDYDLVVIGAGSGGVRASRMSAGLGAKVALIELAYSAVSSETLGGVGGTCVLRGCVPKKILMYGSSFSADFKDSHEFGWDVEVKGFDWKRLIQNKTKEIERLNGVYKKLLSDSGVVLVEGEGRLLDRNTVEVKGPDGEVKKLTAKYILIATGSRAVLLNIPGKELAITSDEALSLEEQPKRVVIVGGGYIAVEFGGIFNGVGSKVDLVIRQQLPLGGFDSDMRAGVLENLQKRGVQVHCGRKPVSIEKAPGGGLLLQLDSGEPIVADAVMFATGRKPNTRRLNLEAVGVETDQIGAIKVNELSQTNIPGVYAVGDVTNRLNLTPVALMEGACFAKTVFGKTPTPVDHADVPSAVFCQPPLSSVGVSQDYAEENNPNDIVVFKSTFTPMKNTISGRVEKTLMKLIVDAETDRVLGCHVLGPDAAEMVQFVGVALKMGATKAQFDSCIGIHPSAAEELVTMRTGKRIPTKKSQPASGSDAGPIEGGSSDGAVGTPRSSLANKFRDFFKKL